LNAADDVLATPVVRNSKVRPDAEMPSEPKRLITGNDIGPKLYGDHTRVAHRPTEKEQPDEGICSRTFAEDGDQLPPERLSAFSNGNADKTAAMRQENNSASPTLTERDSATASRDLSTVDGLPYQDGHRHSYATDVIERHSISQLAVQTEVDFSKETVQACVEPSKEVVSSDAPLTSRSSTAAGSEPPASCSDGEGARPAEDKSATGAALGDVTVQKDDSADAVAARGATERQAKFDQLTDDARRTGFEEDEVEKRRTPATKLEDGNEARVGLELNKQTQCSADTEQLQWDAEAVASKEWDAPLADSLTAAGGSNLVTDGRTFEQSDNGDGHRCDEEEDLDIERVRASSVNAETERRGVDNDVNVLPVDTSSPVSDEERSRSTRVRRYGTPPPADGQRGLGDSPVDCLEDAAVPARNNDAAEVDADVTSGTNADVVKPCRLSRNSDVARKKQRCDTDDDSAAAASAAATTDNDDLSKLAAEICQLAVSNAKKQHDEEPEMSRRGKTDVGAYAICDTARPNWPFEIYSTRLIRLNGLYTIFAVYFVFRL